MGLRYTMAKRAYIIHGWGGFPEEGWFPWLKRELEARGVQVFVPAMPDTDNPKIEPWVSYLTEQVGTPDTDTYLIGHSIGCQAIIRYLQQSGPVGGVVFVAGWFELTDQTDEEMAVAKPWLETPVDFGKVKANAGDTVAIFSPDDPFVPCERSAAAFKERLGSKVVTVEPGWGHFSGSDDVTELPEALAELTRMMEL